MLCIIFFPSDWTYSQIRNWNEERGYSLSRLHEGAYYPMRIRDTPWNKIVWGYKVWITLSV